MLQWRTVPGGPFVMGSDVASAYPPHTDERPRRVVALETFRLSRTPVTNAQYRAFAAATGGDDLPATYVSHDEALAFCEWAGVRLPTEDEWEAASRGGTDRLWPWGDEPPDSTRAVFEGPIGGVEPVGSRPAGASAHGLLDLAGNVCEWVAEPGIVRGGCYVDGPDELRCSHRLLLHPASRGPYVGFRVAGGDSSPVGFDWVELPAGEYAVGRDPIVVYRGPVRADELPQHSVELPPFELSRTPVTVAQYGAFAPPPAPGRDDDPVTLVTWFEAQAFCAWAGGRLPTEAEWEKAARGADARRFPWGDDEDGTRALVGLGLKEGAPEPVGSRPRGAGPYGMLDLAGNVWEWVSSAYAPYPYDPADGREDPAPAAERVLRGGSYASPGLDYARCAMRSHSRPERRQAHIGFRVAR
jgi:formylglycine-generating enzyme required for sulfatase activity